MVFQLSKFCCGCKLKTGAFIIGAIDLVGGISNTAYSISEAAGSNPEHTTNQDIANSLSLVKTVSIINAVVNALLAAISILLIFGAIKSKRVFLLPWLGYSCAFLIIYLATIIAATVGHINTQNNLTAIFLPVCALVAIGIQTYFILVVYSLFKELKDEESKKGTYSSPQYDGSA